MIAALFFDSEKVRIIWSYNIRTVLRFMKKLNFILIFLFTLLSSVMAADFAVAESPGARAALNEAADGKAVGVADKSSTRAFDKWGADKQTSQVRPENKEVSRESTGELTGESTGKPVTGSKQVVESVVDNEQTDETPIDEVAEAREQHFKNIDELVRLRAPGLAYSYLQREQPVYNQQNPLQWLYWEQKRIALLQYMRKWQLVNQRVLEQKEHLSSFKVATGDRNWFLNARLRALLELKQYALVLSETRRLLWNASSLVDSGTLATWRRIIIQVYLNQGTVKDTQIAMRRYQQDYGELKNEDGVLWLQLQAQLLIQLEQYEEAIEKLKKIETSQAHALILLAKLKAGSLSSSDVLDSVQLEMVSIHDDAERTALFQYVALVAAVDGDDIKRSIFLLENLLSDKDVNISGSVVQAGGVKIDADTLWQFYLQVGNKAANSRGLLRGDDVSWYTLASNVYLDEPVIAKSLFAVLSLKSKQKETRQQSMMQLVSLIESNDQSLQLVNRLFTASKKIKHLSLVPAKVRYLLVDYSLLQGDVQNAADLMADLNQSPEGQPKFDWNLRRARVLILSGSFKQGADVLGEMLRPEFLQSENESEGATENTATDENVPPGARSAGITSDQADKYLQVVFDLQAVGQYQLSLDLFDQLQRTLDDVRLERELYFWKAESFHALEQYSMAAYLFLKSSVSPNHVYDPWYHTATFRAAESLLEAGMYEDARQRFLHLLSITDNVARKSVIRQRLQKIQLKEQLNLKKTPENVK